MLIFKDYEASDNCILEYDYVSTLKKKFIPIKVEDYETPVGSLSLMMGKKLYYQLYDDKI